MFKNKKEHFIFILMICTTMVYIMSCYNVALIEGFSANIFVVGKIVGRIAPKFIKEGDSMAKVGIVMSFFTCCGMVLWMSAFGVVTNLGFGPHFFAAYGLGIVRNVIVAIFFKMFPPVVGNTEAKAS